MLAMSKLGSILVIMILFGCVGFFGQKYSVNVEGVWYSGEYEGHSVAGGGGDVDFLRGLSSGVAGDAYMPESEGFEEASERGSVIGNALHFLGSLMFMQVQGMPWALTLFMDLLAVFALVICFSFIRGG